MKVLVTGACGFVGGWLVRALAGRGHEVVAWRRDERISTLNLLGSPAGVTAVTGDVRDAGTWREHLARHSPDAVVHLAAESQVRRALADPREVWTSNTLGTFEACEAARTAARPPNALVIASSDKAYGPARTLPYTEEHPLLASAPYDASKAAADICARSYAASFGLPVAVTRAANLYGGGDLNPARIVPETCRAIIERRNVRLRSDGSPERDYLYVEDVVEGYLRLVEALAAGKIAAGAVFNFGTGEAVAVRCLVELLLAAAGADGHGTALEVAVEGAAGARHELDRQMLDASLARQALGWTPRVLLAEGLARTWQWYREHQRALPQAWR